jgi:putative ABC transport system substrate-binding protein
MTALRLALALGLTLVSMAARVADAQPATIPRIGWLGNGSPAPSSANLEAFRRGLEQRGWIEGQTVGIEYRWAEGKPDRLPALVSELARLQVAVIVLSGTAAIQAARSVTTTVPIVFVYLADPVSAGLVDSLARPGANLTGVASEFDALITKQVELLKEVVPGIARVAILHRPELTPPILSAATQAARDLGLIAHPLKVADVAEFEPAFMTARRAGAGGIHVMPSPFFYVQRRRLAELAARYRLPAMYELKDYVEDGGLMSYGPSINEMFRGAASHVDRILKGAKPRDLPIERPTTFELVVNLKTAKALGLTIPPSVLGRADRAIE